MLSSLREAWSPRINFVVRGTLPPRKRLPGLKVVVEAPALKLWRCCLRRLYSN